MKLKHSLIFYVVSSWKVEMSQSAVLMQQPGYLIELTIKKAQYSPVPNNRGILIKGEVWQITKISIKERGGGGGGLKNILGQKWQPVITNYRCPKLNLIDTGATITLNKIRKANQK